MAYNQSKIKMFRRCQKQYSFRYDYAEKMGKDAKMEMVPRVSKVQLYRGTWMHKLQEVHHRQWAGEKTVTVEIPYNNRRLQKVEVRNWVEAHMLLTNEFNKLFEEEKADLGDLPTQCHTLFKGYLGFHKGDEERYTVATVGGKPAIELTLEVPLDKWGIDEPFKGTIDLLVEDHEFGGLWIWDAKWVKNIPAPDERMMSPQALMYAWALRKMGLDIRGFLYNYGRTKPPAEPQLLKKGVLSTKKNMDTTYDVYLEAIKSLHGDRWKDYARTVYKGKLDDLKGRSQLWYRRERIPVEPERIARGLAEFLITVRDIERRSTKYPPRSYFYNCKFGCEYHNLCVAEFNGLDISPLIKANYQFEGERYGGKEDLLAD